MTLSSGQSLGGYAVLAPLGAGGMGEVFRARDTKLGREVAIKVLPGTFLSDPERLARLEREARLLASLNHPNIATLHAFENVDGLRFLVMELVEGQTLGERLSEGPLPVQDALDFFRQVADGLSAAHRKGVVHRDLKPGNLMIAAGGHAKILDFGLAKTAALPRSGDVTSSPTASLEQTAAGIIQGTAPYMSPEQAKGKAADERSDVFSFGVTLYEALAGKHAFAGDTVTEVLAAVLEREPDLAALPPDTPDLVRFLLRRCLKKSPDDRLRDISEAKALLGEAMASPATTAPTMPALAPGASRGGGRRRLALGLGGLAILAVGLVLGRSISKKAGVTSQGQVRRFRLDLKAEGQFDRPSASHLSLSPDGRYIAYVDGERLRIRDIDRLDGRDVPGSEKASGPFWSPDGRNVAFVAAGFLKRAPIDGGPVRTVCELKPAGSLHLGSTWGPSGSIVVALGPALGLFEVSSEGGDLRPLLRPDPAKGTFDFHWPSFLPDGRTLLLVVHPETGSQFFLAIFNGREIRRLLPEATPPVRSPVYSDTGYILFSRWEGMPSIYAIPFDAAKLTVTGEPIRLIEDASDPSVSNDGALVYVAGGSRLWDLVLVNRAGRVERTISTGHGFSYFPRVSPDGKRVMMSETKDGNLDVWVEDIEKGTRVRLTTGPEQDVSGAWSSSGERVALMSGLWSDSGVVLLPADGSGRAERLPFRSNSVPDGNNVSPDWSPDGRYVIFRSAGHLFYGDVTEKRTPTMFAESSFFETEGRFSPDGRFVAYMSNESGRFEVYVRRFPAGDRKLTVSANGGVLPRWSRTGNELFYIEGSMLMALSVSTHGGFRASPPTRLFDAAAIPMAWPPFSTTARYDPMPDGKAFVVFRQPSSPQKSLVVVENWAAELKQRP